MNAVAHAGAAVLTIRPVEVDDAAALARMFKRLSHESRYSRFFSPLSEVPEPMLRRMSAVDHCRREALVAFDAADLVAIASYDTVPSPAAREAEIAVVVEDGWHRRGVGLRLTRDLAALAFERGIETFVARALPNNRAALAMLRKLTPAAVSAFAGGEYQVRLAVGAVVGDGVVAAARREEM